MLSELEKKSLNTLNNKLINLSYKDEEDDSEVNVIKSTDIKSSKDEIKFYMSEMYTNYNPIEKASQLRSLLRDVDEIKVGVIQNIKTVTNNIAKIEVKH
jgi:hypothetical protein